MQPTRLHIGLALSITALWLSTACVSGSKIRADNEIAKRDVAKARESGAYKCAPRDLALAESNVQFTEDELDQGNWLRANEHVQVALAAVKRALEDSKDCGPKKVLVMQPKIVAVTKTDRDGDGIVDLEDQCPDQPGLPQFQGCPDTDGDGLPDNIDKCPTDPEDKDEFEDEDGCPDFDNDQDGVPDVEDECRNVKGPPENKGCPVQDRDGDGIADPVDSCPDIKEDKDNFEDTDGCPDVDNDKDTIRDATDQGDPDPADKCPNDAEDPDKFQDEDGCPDTDNDGDGILDGEDKCPNEPGPPDSPQGKGCPRKYSLVKINREKKQIEIKQKIFFAYNKWDILPKSFNLLSQVGQVLKDFPKMRVSIEGHTDGDGPDAYNQMLSEKRANSVREYLLGQGIEPERLESVGFGESRPIASNRTARGKETNRRVEFRIVGE